MDKLVNFLMVGLGGAAGSMLRYACNLLSAALDLSGQVSTFFVNIFGSFLIGLITGCCKDGTLLLMLTIGLCGGFTTFSTFSMQNVRLLQEGRIGMAAVYVMATVIVCVAMAWLGYRLGQSR